MPPSRPEPGSAADWLRYARSDLAYAAAPIPTDGLYSVACFHAQQAVEKAIKAVLVHAGIEFERTHSIGRLANLVPDTLPELPMRDAAIKLTRHAIFSRYPADADDLTEEDQKSAARVAAAVVSWAAEIISGD